MIFGNGVNKMHLNSEQLEELLSTIIYGDIHEVPLDILGDLGPKRPSDTNGWDDEQLTRVSAAATVKKFFEQLNY